MKKMLLGIAVILLGILCFLLFAFKGWFKFDTISLCIIIIGLVLVAFGYVEDD